MRRPVTAARFAALSAVLLAAVGLPVRVHAQDTDARQAKTDAQLAENAAQQAKTDAQLAKTDAKLNRLAERYGGRFDVVATRNMARKRAGLQDEFDLALAAFHVHDGLKRQALEQGVTVLQRKGDVIETIAA